MQTRSLPYPHAPFYFLLLLAVAAAGFYPSYFSRFTATDATHHFHGLAATAWILLLIAQGWLMRVRNFAAHRLIGRVSLIVAPLFVISGLLVTQATLRGETPFTRVFGAGLAFVDLTTLAGFSIAYVLAIRSRHETPLHARYLVSTALLLLPPALARALFYIPLVTSFPIAFHGAFLVSEGITLALIVGDLRAGRIRAPYPMLLGLQVVQQVAFVFIPTGTP